MAVPLGLGMVGAGGFGLFCIGAYVELSKVRIVAVAEIDQERARAVAPPGSRAYGRYSTLLADSEVESVPINTPQQSQLRIASRVNATQGNRILIRAPENACYSLTLPSVIARSERLLRATKRSPRLSKGDCFGSLAKTGFRCNCPG